MQQTLWQQGVELMLFGMGTVFLFLAILIIMTSIMSSLIQRFVNTAPVSVIAPSEAVAQPNEKDEQLVAVISAAIHKYRSRHK